MSLDHRRGCRALLALGGLVFSTGGVLLQDPLLSTSLKGSDNISVVLPFYAYLFFLNPLTFYLNMLLVLLHVTKHTGGAPRAPLPVFLLNHLPKAAHAVTFTNLLFGMPLWIQVVVSERTVGFAIGAMLVCITLISLLASVFKKFLISCRHAGRGTVPALFALCVSTGFLIFFDPILSFSNTNHYDLLIHTALHYLLLFVIFVIFMLGITLLILCLSPASEGQIQAENWAIIALSVAFAILLIGAYMKACLAVTDMAAVGVEAAGI